MPDFLMTRTHQGLAPATTSAADAIAKIKLGKAVNVKVIQPRNGKFHRKFFAMLDVAFQNHEWPEIETKWGKATTSSELFRKYVIVRAGHYEAALTPHGEVRAEPKSISFAKMSEDDFEKLYSDVLDVILNEFLTNWKTGDMENAVNQMLEFC